MKKPISAPTPALEEQAAETQALVKAMPANPNKPKEIGRANAVSPPLGATHKPASQTVGASTLSERNQSPKTGTGRRATASSLDHVRTDAADQVLTTNQGVAIGDNQNSLKAGLRGPTLLEDFILRE